MDYKGMGMGFLVKGGRDGNGRDLDIGKGYACIRGVCSLV
jgi:hypothetical protein